MPTVHASKGIKSEVFRRSTTGNGDAFSLPDCEFAVAAYQGIGGTVTGLIVDAEISPDGGTTWQKVQTALNLVTAPQRFTIAGMAGYLCRFVSTTFTLGTASAVAIVISPGG